MSNKKRTTVSINEEVKQYADENDINISQAVEQTLKRKMDSDKDRLQKIREEKQEVSAQISVHRRRVNELQDRLEELESEIEEIKENRDNLVNQMINAVIELHKLETDDPGEEENAKKALLRTATTTDSITPHHIREAFNEAVDERTQVAIGSGITLNPEYTEELDMDIEERENPDHIKEFIENNKLRERDGVSLSTYLMEHLTPVEESRVKDYVKREMK